MTLDKFRFVTPTRDLRARSCACGASQHRVYHTDRLVHTPEECYELVAV